MPFCADNDNEYTFSIIYSSELTIATLVLSILKVVDYD